MITQKDIEFSLNYWNKVGKLKTNDLINIDILTPKQYAEINSCTVREAYESIGRFDWVLTFLDENTYLGIEADLEKEDVDDLIYNFLKELNLI